MDISHMKKNVMAQLFYIYLKCLEKTVKIEWEQPEEYTGHGVVGFWHEDSFAMNLVLQKITEAKRKTAVLVTGDSRGDYIEYILEKCGGQAVRVGYGFCNAGMLRDLLHMLEEPNGNVAISMDGPLGPRHIPKKMTFFLSEKSRTPLTGITLSYSHKLALTNRWDHYRIPIPFSTIRVRFDGYGVAAVHRRSQSLINEGK